MNDVPHFTHIKRKQEKLFGRLAGGKEEAKHDGQVDAKVDAIVDAKNGDFR